ncbi:hypothetical protein C8F01DRAFT_1166634, partial [Mycena amicta]
VLAIADIWEIKVARQFAIDQLCRLDPPLTPVRRLELSQKYTILRWIPQAVEDIMSRKLSMLSDLDLDRLGSDVVRKLVLAHELKEQEIKRIAQVEPKMVEDPDWRCDTQTHQLCITTWHRLWWDKIGRRLLHPENPISTSEIKAEAEHIHHRDLNGLCQRDMMETIRNLQFADQRVVVSVAEAIKTYYRGLSMKQYGDDEV